MDTASTIFLVLDLTGVFAFALNGALTAIRVARLDVVGVVTLGMITALGGGIIRDIFIDSLPPATFSDWRYLAVTVVAGLIAFRFHPDLARIERYITWFDAMGLGLFCVLGTVKALVFGLDPVPAALMGMVTGILPVVGVPLPLMSYGGTAAVTLGLGAGILMSIRRSEGLMQT